MMFMYPDTNFEMFKGRLQPTRSSLWRHTNRVQTLLVSSAEKVRVTRKKSANLANHCISYGTSVGMCETRIISPVDKPPWQGLRAVFTQCDCGGGGGGGGLYELVWVQSVYGRTALSGRLLTSGRPLLLPPQGLEGTPVKSRTTRGLRRDLAENQGTVS